MAKTKLNGWVMLVSILALAVYVQATPVTLYVPDDGHDGAVDSWGGTFAYSYVGEVNRGAWITHRAVQKFQIDPVLAGQTVQTATLYLKSAYLSNGSIDVQLSHYTFDNTDTVSHNPDWTTPSIETVGTPTTIDAEIWYSWDVTNAVKSDVQNGWNYTSFVLSADNASQQAVLFADHTYGSSYLGYIDVTYTPEPATLILLSLGGLIFRKRKE